MPHTRKPINTGKEGEARFLDRINGQLKEYGVILESDRKFPSIVATIIGEPVRGSWWGHPKGMIIYNLLKKFGEQTDVLTVKLLSGKTTFVHRPLWPALLTIATSNEDWQKIGLSREEKRLYDMVQGKGELRTDEYSKRSRVSVGELGESARELERRLLVYGEGFHSNLGSHAKRLATWDQWASDHKYKWKSLELTRAKEILERICERSSVAGKIPRLPWRREEMG